MNILTNNLLVWHLPKKRTHTKLNATKNEFLTSKDFPSDPGERVRFVEDEIKKKNCKWLGTVRVFPAAEDKSKKEIYVHDVLDPGNIKNKVRYSCLIHLNKTYDSPFRLFLKPGVKPKCCQNATQTRPHLNELFEKAKRYGHQIFEPYPTTHDGLVEGYCPKHKYYFTTNNYAYRELTVTGTFCCGSELSATTRLNLGPPEGLKSRDLNQRGDVRAFKLAVPKIRAQNLTLPTAPGVEPPVEVHHLYSMRGYVYLIAATLNGVVLDKDLHKLFHNWRGQNKPTTAQDFINFLNLFKTGSLLLPGLEERVSRLRNLYTDTLLDRFINQIKYQDNQLKAMFPREFFVEKLEKKTDSDA